MLETKSETKQTTDMMKPDSEQALSPQIVKIDYALYEQYLETSGLSEAEKQEFLDALWSIIVNFVDLGFGVHPLQQACEQKLEKLALPKPEMLNLPGQMKTKSEKEKVEIK